jgi:hypothetical protein
MCRKTNILDQENKRTDPFQRVQQHPSLSAVQPSILRWMSTVPVEVHGLHNGGLAFRSLEPDAIIWLDYTTLLSGTYGRTRQTSRSRDGLSRSRDGLLFCILGYTAGLDLNLWLWSPVYDQWMPGGYLGSHQYFGLVDGELEIAHVRLWYDYSLKHWSRKEFKGTSVNGQMSCFRKKSRAYM